MNTKSIGDLGEAAAVKLLKRKGFKILETNYFMSFGEIDIIAKNKKTLVFVEVKTRKSDEFGKPGDAVGRSKQKRIIMVANHYISTFEEDLDVRFDVIEVTADGNKVSAINHIEGAFICK